MHKVTLGQMVTSPKNIHQTRSPSWQWYYKTISARKWKYLENVTNNLIFSNKISAGLLIEANCTKALELIEILQSRNGGSYAFKTQLGWCVVGSVSRTERIKVSCHQIPVNQADRKEVGKNFFKLRRRWKRMTCQICCENV